jgi:hypothetical protein
MDKIPASLKKYIKKARANRRENKISYKSPKQIAKQNQIVIINQDPIRRRGPYKKRGIAGGSGSGGGSGEGGNQYPRIVYIPQSVPNMTIPMNNPQQISQPIPPSMTQFLPRPVYKNPLRLEPFRSALNPPPFTENKPSLFNMEQNIFTQPKESPPPLEPDIVLEPNRLFMPSTPVQAFPITSGGNIGQGFTENQAVNQLNEEVLKEEKAYADFGGEDAQQMRLAKQLSGGSFYESQKKFFESEPESDSPRSDIGIGGGGGGSGRRGRPFTSLTADQELALYTFYRYKYDTANRRKLFDKEAQILYDKGRKLDKDKKNNPEVIKIREFVANERK